MGETTIGGYEVLGELGDSKRFRAFRASRRTPEGERRGTLYLMTDEVRHPDLFIETVDTIRAAWPFDVESDRDYVLPKAQLWTGRPWFFLPEMLPVASSGRIAGRAAFASLRAQLRWLEQFHPPGGEPHFAHGDVRKERIALFDAEHPLLIAPGWVAASELARGKSLSHVRGDDVWHLGKLWIQESDHSFVPDGMEPEQDEAARRLPRARLPQRSAEVAATPPREARRENGARREAAPLRDVSAATPPPGRAAAKREGAGGMTTPAGRTSRPVRETPAGREALRQAPFPREVSPLREPSREPPAREAPPVREAPPLRDVPPVREVARARESREPAIATASAAPGHPPGSPAGRAPAPAAASPAAPPVRTPATTAPTVPITPLRTPAGPPVVSAPPAASAPPVREAPAAARPRPVRQTPPAQVASLPPYDVESSAPEHAPSAPPFELNRPAPSPVQVPEPSPPPAPVAKSYYPSTQPSDPAAPGAAPRARLRPCRHRRGAACRSRSSWCCCCWWRSSPSR
jgi:hypothetical protein